MSNPTLSTDALKAERLAAFINLAKVSPLAVANVLAAVIDDCEKEMGKVATLERQVADLKKFNASLNKELDARTAEFEEKYYGLDLENRRLRKTIELRGERIKHLEERFAVVTMRLAQAEAALGVFCPEGLDEPCNDEWDALSDEALRNA